MSSKKPLQVNNLNPHQLLETIPSGLFLVDTEMHIVFWNRAAERITGYSAHEVIGQHCSFLNGIECGRSCGLFDPDAPQKPTTGAICRIRHKDGHHLILSKNIDLLLDGETIIGGIESFNDCTEQKKLEEALQRQKQQLEETVRDRTEAMHTERAHLRQILDAMDDLAYIVSADYRIDFLNAAMRRTFGEICGQTCYRAIHDSDTPCPDCPWIQIRAGQTVHHQHNDFRGERIYDVIHTPMVTPEGILKLAVCRDVTERHQAHERLLEANRQLDAFVYTVAHDLRSPLTPIIGFAEFLQTEYRNRLDTQGLELLHDIETQGQRMLTLMDDLLALSRVGHIDPPTALIDTDAVLDEILLERAQELIGIEVRRSPLPSLLIPESLIGELLDNLLANAIRYGCPDGLGRIEIEGALTASERCITIRDHGPGIPEDERQRVFDVFYRGRQARALPGTGIGLATVQKIVRLYDGQIRLDDSDGGGCTVELHFPLPG
jgi:PAS domain S-box-containing protein